MATAARVLQLAPIRWPAPEAIPFDMLVNYGYSGEVLFPIEVTAPRNLRPGRNATLIADAYWLVCSDICIPEEATLTLTLPVAAAGPRRSAMGGAHCRSDRRFAGARRPALKRALARVRAPERGDGGR